MKNKSTIAVTGGLGYIGSHTVVELILSGYEVIVLDDLSNSDANVLIELEKLTKTEIVFYQVDLRNSEELEAIFKIHKITSVFHFASSIYVDESMEKPLDYYHNNLVSLLSLLKVMEQNKVKNLVYSSSCTVYGEPEFLPISESSTIQNSPSPYGKTKVMSEMMLQDLCELTDTLKVVSLRYFNPVGAHESGLIGEKQGENPKHLFPIIMDVLSGKRKNLKVFGTDYNTKDGTAIRDYVHVIDIAKAHVLAIEAFEKESKYQYYNLGSGTGFSVKEILQTFEKELKVTISFTNEERRSGDVPAIWADNSKAKKELNWEVTRSLSDMISSAYSWYKKQSKR